MSIMQQQIQVLDFISPRDGFRERTAIQLTDMDFVRKMQSIAGLQLGDGSLGFKPEFTALRNESEDDLDLALAKMDLSQLEISTFKFLSLDRDVSPRAAHLDSIPSITTIKVSKLEAPTW